MKRESVRAVILTIILIVTVIVEAFLLKIERLDSKQMVMRYQLQAVRTSVNLFKAIERRNPATFKELATSTFRFPGESENRHFLEGVLVTPAGEAVDPFGHAYAYDPVSGWVRSNSAGYLDW